MVTFALRMAERLRRPAVPLTRFSTAGPLTGPVRRAQVECEQCDGDREDAVAGADAARLLRARIAMAGLRALDG